MAHAEMDDGDPAEWRADPRAGGPEVSIHATNSSPSTLPSFEPLHMTSFFKKEKSAQPRS